MSALSVWTFAAARVALGFSMTTPDGWQLMAPGAELAFVAAVVATCGGIVRARWAALASLIAATGCALASAQVSGPLTMRVSAMRPEVFRIGILALVGSGALAAVLTAVVGWKTARTTLGTLRAIAS